MESSNFNTINKIINGGKGKKKWGQNTLSKKSFNPLEGHVPILQYGKRNNFLDFRQKLSIYAENQFGTLGRIIEDLQYHEPPPLYHEPEDFLP